MSPRLLAQLGALALAESNALRDDPDGKLKKKDGGSEHARDDLLRPLSPEEEREAARLEMHASRLFYAARASGFTCTCEDHLWLDPAGCFRLVR